MMYAGVDSDININHPPPSGHGLTWTPQEETGFIIFCSLAVFYSVGDASAFISSQG